MSDPRRVLLLVDHGRNREVLAEWLDREEALAAAGGDDGELDLVILDAAALGRRRDWLRERRAAELPAYLPCVLITPHEGVTMLTADLWRDVDEVLTTPIRTGELRVRLERLLRLRAESVATARRLAELGRSNTDLQQFAFVAAHELATPLTIVIGVLETVIARFGEAGGADGAALLVEARRGAYRLQQLVDDLLAYSHAGRQARVAPVPLDELVPEALEALAPQLHESGAELRIAPLPVALADRAQLRLVFSNLVDNALKYSDPTRRPLIAVSALERDGEVEVAVADNGIGIGEESADAVFEMFEREQASGGQPGTGIGLALCRRIVEGHGGRIWVEAAPEGGSVFRFTLRRPG